MSAPVIYVIAEPSVPKTGSGRMIDLAPLAEYGQDVRYLVMRGQAPTFIKDGLYHQIRASLAQFDAEHDYLVWAGGDALGAVMVGMALASMGVTRFRWLRHERSRLPDGRRDPSRGRYVPILVEPNEGRKTNDQKTEIPEPGGARAAVAGSAGEGAALEKGVQPQG